MNRDPCKNKTSIIYKASATSFQIFKLPQIPAPPVLHRNYHHRRREIPALGVMQMRQDEMLSRLQQQILEQNDDVPELKEVGEI